MEDRFSFGSSLWLSSGVCGGETMVMAVEVTGISPSRERDSSFVCGSRAKEHWFKCCSWESET